MATARHPSETLGWNLLKHGDGRASMSEWKKASAFAEGSGLLLLPKLKNLSREGAKGSPIDSSNNGSGPWNSPIRGWTTVLRNESRLGRDSPLEGPRLVAQISRGDSCEWLGSSCSSSSVETKGFECLVGDVKPRCSVGLAYLLTYRATSYLEKSSTVREIMHQFISDRLFTVTVVRHVSADLLGQRFEMNPDYVKRYWVVNGEDEIEEPSTSSYERRRTSYDELIRNGTSQPVDAQELSLALFRAMNTQSQSCGLSQNFCHSSVKLSCENRLSTRAASGLYRSVQAEGAISPRLSKPIYFEARFHSDPEGRGGICVGLATNDFSLDRLVGYQENSVGYHASGDIIENGKWTKFGEPYGEGDTIACLVEAAELSEDTIAEESQMILAEVPPQQVIYYGRRTLVARVTFFKNAKKMGSIPLWVGRAGARPTISLYREHSKVEYRCCAEDLEMHKEIDLPRWTRSVCKDVPVRTG